MILNDSKEKLQQAVCSYDKNLNPQKTIFAEPFACIIHLMDKLLANAEYASLKDKNVAIIGAGNAGMAF
jgi:threonine dehydrogenase-like Zn-dependent dehydrogenase